MRRLLIVLGLLAGSLVAAWAAENVYPGSGWPSQFIPYSSTNPLPTASTTTPVAETPATGGVLKASAGSLLTVSADAVTATTDLKLLVFNSATLPADGAVTPYKCVSFKGDGTQASLLLSWSVPLAFSAGIAIAVSSATACTTKASVAATISGQVQ